MYMMSVRRQRLLKVYCFWTETSLMKKIRIGKIKMCGPLYSHPPFTADVMTAILVSGVTSQNKIIFHRFYSD